MTINNWLYGTVRALEASDIGTASLDAEVLLADELEVDRSWLHAHPDFELQGTSLQLLDAQVEHRAGHEPLAYIRGKQEFYGRDFYVSQDTLVPRPETEGMIEMMLSHLSNEQGAVSGEGLQIVDVGTGSGCIIITAALELTTYYSLLPTRFLGLDISKKALKIAQKNAQKHNVDIHFKHFDLLNSELSSLFAPRSSLIILANLPYVPTEFPINLAASHEPPFAIYGGVDGLNYYRILFQQLASLRPLLVLTESLPAQHKKLEEIAQTSGFEKVDSSDFIQVFS